MMQLFTRLVLAALLLSASSASAAQLTYGKYFGTIQMEGQTEAIAVSLDAFVTQIQGPTTYPALDVIVRANLGGYSSSEYVGYHFYDPTFNFEKGILQLNDPKEDLTASLQISNSDTETVLEGPVTHRLTNSKGRMRLVMALDDSDSNSAPMKDLVPLLKGEYSGSCGKNPTKLQIETARGLGASASGNALAGYTITGRLGSPNAPICIQEGKAKEFCSQYIYSFGTYSPFTNRLTLQGPLGNLECNKNKDSLQCKLLGYDREQQCELKKATIALTPPMQLPAGIFLPTSPEQMAALSSPQPPGNEALVSELHGTFYGFLHHENRDVYQLMEMSVEASTSTENPHIQNQVMVTPTILLRAGKSWNSVPALSLAYPQRVFWLNQGFAFESQAGEYFVVIADWRKGYVSGVLYSRVFGRVGTFELGKSVQPEIPGGMKIIPSLAGNYRGPIDAPKPMKNIWNLTVEIPNQSPGPEQTGMPLIGRYYGPGLLKTFDASSFDLNTGSLGFLIKHEKGDRLITGEPIADGQLKLLWPVGPVLGSPMSNYLPYTYSPKKD